MAGTAIGRGRRRSHSQRRLAKGGDQYPFPMVDFTPYGVSYQQALFNFIVEELNGVISAEDYPEGGEGRITKLD